MPCRTYVSRLLLVVVLSFFWGGNAQGQERKLRFEVDFARFRTASDFVLLEIYYSIYRDQLKFIPEDHRWRADFQIETRILQGDSVLVKDKFKKSTFADSLAEIRPSQHLVDLTPMIIKPGEYRLVSTLTDLNAGGRVSVDRIVTVTPFPSSKLAISDIELASSLKKNETSDRFTKNTYQIIPNPGGLYGSGAPLLYFYAEVYNLETGGQRNRFRSRYTILDPSGKIVRTLEERERAKPGNSCVLVSGFNIISLHSGPYFLKMEIEDLDSGEQASRLKKIFVYRSGDFANTAAKGDSSGLSAFLKAPEYQSYDVMDMNELIEEFQGASYLATSEEKEIFQGLDLAGRRQFMKKFWLDRDPDYSTIQNEFRRDYLKRLRYANRNFGSGKPGWKADRGRVLLVYGEPDEVERYPSSAQNRAYEIWHYYSIQGGVIFIFVDVRGFGDYLLIHSTARDELQDPDWKRWINPQK